MFGGIIWELEVIIDPEVVGSCLNHVEDQTKQKLQQKLCASTVISAKNIICKDSVRPIRTLHSF